jgi:hypothetical protein
MPVFSGEPVLGHPVYFTNFFFFRNQKRLGTEMASQHINSTEESVGPTFLLENRNMNEDTT